MKLTPKELDKIKLASVGEIAQKRMLCGIRLNIPEAIGLLSYQIMHFARTGKHSVASLMSLGQSILGRNHVIPGVESIIDEVQIEAMFPDGTKLVTLHNPICRQYCDMTVALAGSGISTPGDDPFGNLPHHPEEGLIPGELLCFPGLNGDGGSIVLNKGRRYIELQVMNTADRPIQVGSHFHFIETNKYLQFDRRASYGMRLNVAAGASVRFEPGESKTVSLVSIGGKQVIRGGNNLCNGVVDWSKDSSTLSAIMERIKAEGFADSQAGSEPDGDHGAKRRRVSTVENASADNYDGLVIPRQKYVRMFGPTTGDVVRLADTELFIRVEKDHTVFGDECKFGGGKVLREGMGQATGLTPEQQLDTVITNTLIVDAVTGIIKADVGIKNGRIIGIGKAGNPDVMDGVTPGMVCGVNTEAIAGEGLILTAGGMDSHVHFICPQILEEALASGLTTMLGGGTGPASGTCATTCTPGPMHLKMMLEATDEIPMNIALTGKGNTSAPEGLEDIVKAGAVGLKLHEDWGTTPAAIDNCLTVADKHDVQVTIHTDTLNESSCVEHTVAAFKGRTIHTYHTEGAGGGHAPDIITVAGLPNVLPSSTNPTRPLTVNTMDEHLDMLMVCHHLNKSIPEDIAFAESRIRIETVAAEDILQDTGAISIISSDSQAMGRVGEVIIRSWQTADKMKHQRGQLPEDAEADKKFPIIYTSYAPNQGSDGSKKFPVQTDNFRVRRYIAKYTINPCIAHGMSTEIGTVEVGKLADLVLWDPAFFGVKPQMVIKGGNIAWSQMGDANASIPTPQPVWGRPMFGSKPRVAANSSIAFVSRSCVESGTAASYNLRKTVIAIKNTRNVGKKDMVLNDSMPAITVDPETYSVTADGERLICAPAEVVPLAQRYFLF